MPKPPASPPHSDLDGVHEDAYPTPDAARAGGPEAGDLEKAREELAGRPPRADEKSRDDRSR